MAPATTHHKSRYFYMTEVDEAAFSLALREAFPDLRLIDNNNTYELSPGYLDRIDTTRDMMVYLWHVPPEWMPEVGVNDLGRKFLRRPPLWARFFRCWWFPRGGVGPAAALPTLENGDIWGSFTKQDKAQQAFLRKVWRIFAKLTMNKFVYLDRKTGKVLGEHDGSLWAGFDAVAYCREDPMNTIGETLRPREDWVPPETPWHRALNDRLVALKIDTSIGYPQGYGPPERKAGRWLYGEV